MSDFIKIESDLSNYKEVSEKFRKEIVKARRKGMNKVATDLKKETKPLIKNNIHNATKANSKYNDKLIDAVRVSKYKDVDLLGEAIAGTHIMGIRKKGSGTFRLKFFENGTKNRYIKDHKRKSKNGLIYRVSGHSTGKIKSTNFFKSATDKVLPKAQETIERYLKEAIDRCNR